VINRNYLLKEVSNECGITMISGCFLAPGPWVQRLLYRWCLSWMLIC